MTEKNTTTKGGNEEVRISPRTGKPIDKKYAPKNKRKPGGGNNWLDSKNVLSLEDGDNTKFMTVQMALLEMPEINMESVEEVERRLLEYFALYAQYDIKPTVAGMAMALNGMSRQSLWAIAKGVPTGGAGYKTALPQNVADAIKKAYNSLETLWEGYMLNGKINPVSGIFLGKNNYGYQDKTEHVLTPNQRSDSDYSAEEIRQRYIAEGSQKQLSGKTGSDFESE